MKIALAGNPNSGKTTLYNALTGKTEHVGNWAGVTIEKKEGIVKKNYSGNSGDIRVVDLPGAYSITPFTSEEGITSRFIREENPDVIINIVDAASLSRSLFFTTQLSELGIPMVVALNKSDLLAKREIGIDTARLQEILGCPVVSISSVGKAGLKELIAAAMNAAGSPAAASIVPSGVLNTPQDDLQAADRARFEFVEQVIRQVEVRSQNTVGQSLPDAVDRIVAHPFWGIPIFAAVIFSVFSLSQSVVGPFFADILVGWTDAFASLVEGSLGEHVSPLLSALLLDGVIGGVGAVVGFLPLIMVLFFLLALLEDCGYMARVAVVMDRHLKKVGLSGRSIIPMVVGTGCAIPGVMATRTIRDDRQRRTTAMLTPFMPCGAKLPVIALFAGVFFQDAAWVGTSMYFAAIAIVIFGALVINRITKNSPSQSFFIMELPEYRLPSIKRAFATMMSRAWAFIVKAATIILLCNAIIHVMQTFTFNLQVVEEGMQAASILAVIAKPVAWLLIPLGFGMWQLAAAAVTGFIAKENVVGTLAVVYGIGNFIDTENLVLTSGAGDVASIMGLTSASALAYLVFNLFTPPCFAAIGAMNAEMESKKWLAGGIAFQLGMGYAAAFFVYQIGTLLTLGTFGQGVVPGFMAVAAMAGTLLLLMREGDKKAPANTKEAYSNA